MCTCSTYVCIFRVHVQLYSCFPIYLAPADVHGSIQRVSLHKVPVDVLPRLLRWFSQAKHLACHDIHPPQEVQCVHMYRESDFECPIKVFVCSCQLYILPPPITAAHIERVLLGRWW